MVPGRELSANYKGHWSKKAKLVKIFKDAAYYCALQANPERITLSKASVELTFVVPDLRYVKDPDNAIASVKAAIDGCVLAGIVPDDSSEYLSYRMPIMWEHDKTRAPLTILEFKEATK
ncbi:hypothetical protein LCGC14_1956660 [marine sediment metagenome]|uniref:Uncharacterized protein n=1 Tax=marine sediment metagenome TaxID=412755 RepID=A0A0F9ICX2_9ZZZZ